MGLLRRKRKPKPLAEATPTQRAAQELNRWADALERSMPKPAVERYPNRAVDRPEGKR